METAEVKEIPNTRSISDEEAINVANATILYRSYKEQPNTLKETILNFVKHGKVKYYSTFPALNNISFTVKNISVWHSN